MKVLKSKSLSKCLTDEEMGRMSNVVRFISFEAAIRSFLTEYNISEKPIGYRVTEQGVEMLFD